MRKWGVWGRGSESVWAQRVCLTWWGRERHSFAHPRTHAPTHPPTHPQGRIDRKSFDQVSGHTQRRWAVMPTEGIDGGLAVVGRSVGRSVGQRGLCGTEGGVIGSVRRALGRSVSEMYARRRSLEGRPPLGKRLNHPPTHTHTQRE